MATHATGYGRLPFQEQIAFFRNKRDVLTESYLDVFGAEHDIAFMVAGANRDDLLADLGEAIRKAIEDGNTLAQFRADFDQIVARYGWDYTGGRNWRTRVIYETNLRQSYHAGRQAQFDRMRRARPYLRYRHDDSVEHPRPIHESWDGLVLYIDDPWLLTHSPSNGYGCQCYLEALSERDLRRLGKSGPDQAPPVNWQTVTIGQRSPGGPRVVMTPEGIDPGFAYAPGRSLYSWPHPSRGGPVTPPNLQGAVERVAQMALTKTMRRPAAQAAESAARVLGMQRARDALQAGFAWWLGSSDAQRDSGYVVGAIAPAIVRAMSTRGTAPATAAISATSAVGLPAGLPALLANPGAVLRDTGSNALLYIAGSGRHRRLLQVDTSSMPNRVTDASLDLAAIRRRVRTGELELLQGAL